MNDTEITSLAREYAEVENPISDYEENNDEEYRNVDLDMCRGYAESVIHFLLSRYCLVEKDKVREMYKEAADSECELGKMQPQNTYAKNSIAMRIGVNFGCIHTLKSLFPHLGKEVGE